MSISNRIWKIVGVVFFLGFVLEFSRLFLGGSYRPPGELQRFYERVNPSLTRWLWPVEGPEASRSLSGSQFVFAEEGWIDDGQVYFYNPLGEILNFFSTLFPGESLVYVGALTDLECRLLDEYGPFVIARFQPAGFSVKPSCGEVAEDSRLLISLSFGSHILVYSHISEPILEFLARQMLANKSESLVRLSQSEHSSLWDCRVVRAFGSHAQPKETSVYHFHSRDCRVLSVVPNSLKLKWEREPLMQRMKLWQSRVGTF